MLLGKPNQTLIGHVTDCLTSMNARVNRDEDILKTVCEERLGTDWNEVLACLRYAAVMHDIGKATDGWQREQAERIRTQGNHSLVTHALPSAFITAETLRLSDERIDTARHAMTLAILGHHGQLHNQSAVPFTPLRGLSLLDEGWQQLATLAHEVSGFTLGDFPTGKSIKLGDMGNAFTPWKTALPKRRSEAIRFKALYSLIVSLLRTCDSAASKFAGEISVEVASSENPGGAFLGSSADTPFLYDWQQVRKADILNGRSPNVLQNREPELNGLFNLLNAGCGEGKTGLALLHFQRLMSENKVNRIIFTLPTKFTSNNMYRDFRDVYQLPAEAIGLCHSDSLSFLRQEISEEERDSANELNGRDKLYDRPITISTVDHLLMSLYHGYKQADQAFGNILQSLIVFDELHHYETLTVSAINETLAVLRILHIPHLIMTATIPDTRIAAFNQRSPGDAPLTYTALVSDGREEKAENGLERRIKKAFIFRKDPISLVNAIRVDGVTYYNVSPALINDLREHQTLRQIVFVNQVEKAKAVAKACLSAGLSNICYHAEFVGQDRTQKETEIRTSFKADEPCILIATQIAELSLDISADRMHSEIAPLDDIAQRGGRLHRNGITSDREDGSSYEMIVHALDFQDKSDVLPYVNLETQASAVPHLLERSWNILPDGAAYGFDNVRTWVNELYKETDRLTHPNFREAITSDIVFGSKPQDRYSESGEEGDGQVIIRAKEFETFDVIPKCFEDCLSDNREANRAFVLKINQFKFWKSCRSQLVEKRPISVLTFKRSSGKSEHETTYYLILKRKYTYAYGIDFTGEDEYDTEPVPFKIASNILGG